jgi:hypothetical protein
LRLSYTLGIAISVRATDAAGQDWMALAAVRADELDRKQRPGRLSHSKWHRHHSPSCKFRYPTIYRRKRKKAVGSVGFRVASAEFSLLFEGRRLRRVSIK